MAFHGSNEWAVIRSGSSKKIKSIRLTDWFEWEWNDFSTIKNKDDIIWFDEKEEANDFITETFERHEIDDDVLADTDLPDGYNW